MQLDSDVHETDSNSTPSEVAGTVVPRGPETGQLTRRHLSDDELHDPRYGAETAEERGGDPFPLLLTDILDLQRSIEQSLAELLRPEGISFSRYELLSLLDTAPKGTLTKPQVDSQLKKERSTTYHLMSGLEQTGYVDWHRNPSDRRQTVVSITAAGRARLDAANHRLRSALSSESPESVGTTRAMLTQLHHLLSQVLDTDKVQYEVQPTRFSTRCT
ncbi:MarR family winged helix-turn-helix transcriptional regulator [Rhodococcus koreensis]|uniref:MarR family winged helix-turn-helix transcriptional regulator n=1 Tax=Rhodococcus koreensis TaxID=99653 RepID=UPI003670E81C